MASLPFPGPWSPAQRTGNSVYVIDSANTIWLIGNSPATLYKSTNYGTSFTAVATLTGISSLIAFDGVIAIDASGTLHIIGQEISSSNQVTLVQYSYATTTATLTGPFTLLSEITGSDYDIVCLANGHTYVATIVLTQANEQLLGMEVSAAGVVLRTDTISTESFDTGSAYSSVSLYTPDGVNIEVYMGVITKDFDFIASTALITFSKVNAGAIIAPTVLTTFEALHLNGKLTVISNGDVRYLSTGYYLQNKGSLLGVVMLGYQASASANSAWTFSTYSAALQNLTQTPVPLTIFGTGLDAEGVTVPIGSVDIHYTLTHSADPVYIGPNVYTGSNNGWIGSYANWISPSPVPRGIVALGSYTYETTFTIPDTLDPSTAYLSGQWAVDDSVIAYLNGTEVAQAHYFGTLAPFTITTGFVAGLNRLDFVVTNAGASANPSGILIEIEGYATPYQSMTLNTGIASTTPVEPTLSQSSEGLVLAIISANLNQFGAGAPIVLFNVNATASVLVPRTDFHYPGLANWLRGSKNMLPATMQWGFLSQRSIDGVGRFYTGYNSPPVVELTPTAVAAQRGITYSFDAGSSYDPNMGTLSFAWGVTGSALAMLTTNGSKATVTLPSSAGPAAVTLVLWVMVSKTANGATLTSTANATLTYPAIAAPTVANIMMTAARNARIVITPTVTYSPYVTPSFSWAQTSGTTVAIDSPTDLETLIVNTDGALVGGESLVFTLTVNDGMNPPVSGTNTLIVPARAATGETAVVNTYTYSGNIAGRNTAGSWGSPAASTVTTGFTDAKRAPLLNSTTGSAYILISPKSVVVQRNGVSYHALTPDPTTTILDAVHANIDYTVLLTSNQELVKILPDSPVRDTDRAAAIITLDSISPSTYTKIMATPPYNGQRVFVLSGPDGVLLVQADNSFNLTGSLVLGSEQLYGSANVTFVRAAGLENIHTGLLLIGTADAAGNSYETEYLLPSHSVTGVWDSSQIRNPVVSTGELLNFSTDSYSGMPLAPLLSATTTANTVNLTWTQTRPDLVKGYNIYVSENGGAYNLAVAVLSGQVMQTSLSLDLTQSYTIRMLAVSYDGDSPYSNTVTLTPATL